MIIIDHRCTLKFTLVKMPHFWKSHVMALFLLFFIFKCFFYFVLPMFFMKPKFTIYKSSFISIVYARYTQLILPMSYMHQGGAILAICGLKLLFTILFLLVYLNNIPSLEVKLVRPSHFCPSTSQNYWSDLLHIWYTISIKYSDIL